MALKFDAVLDEGEPQAPPPLAVAEDMLPELAVPKAMSIEAVKLALKPYEGQISLMVGEALAISKVSNDVEVGDAVARASSLKRLYKRVEDFRKLAGEPALRYKKALDNLAKSFTDQLAKGEVHLKGLIGQYQHRIEMERRKAEAAAREAAAKLQKEIDKEAKKAGVEPVQVQAPVIPAAPTITRTEEGTASLRHVWSFKVVNEDQVPRDYLMVDSQKIRAAVKAGVREIPGVEIYEEVQTAIRA